MKAGNARRLDDVDGVDEDGVMDLRVMVVVTAAITVERLAPLRGRIACALGGVVLAAGLLLLANTSVQGQS